MGRLIDADKLLNMRFSNGLNNDGILYVPFGEVIRNIKNAPTAYDIEKVVKCLDEASHWEEPTFDEDGYCNDDSWEVVYLDKAIEIVRKGGAT